MAALNRVQKFEKLKEVLRKSNIKRLESVVTNTLKDQYMHKVLTDEKIITQDNKGFARFNNAFIINEKSIQGLYNMKKRVYKKNTKKIKNNKKNTTPISNTPVDNSSSSKIKENIELAMQIGDYFMTLGNQINEIKIVQHGNIAALMNFDDRIKDLTGKINTLTELVKGAA